MKDGSVADMQTPSSYPTAEEMHYVKHFEEPVVLGTLVFPKEHIGDLISLCESKRGEQRVRCAHMLSERERESVCVCVSE